MCPEDIGDGLVKFVPGDDDEFFDLTNQNLERTRDLIRQAAVSGSVLAGDGLYPVLQGDGSIKLSLYPSPISIAYVLAKSSTDTADNFSVSDFTQGASNIVVARSDVRFNDEFAVSADSTNTRLIGIAVPSNLELLTLQSVSGIGGTSILDGYSLQDVDIQVLGQNFSVYKSDALNPVNTALKFYITAN